MADMITTLSENIKKTGPQHDAKVNSMPHGFDDAAQLPGPCTQQRFKTFKSISFCTRP